MHDSALMYDDMLVPCDHTDVINMDDTTMGVVDGASAVDQLAASLVKIVRTEAHTAFVEFIGRKHLNIVANQRWVTSAVWLRAAADYDLLDMVEGGAAREGDLRRAIEDPRGHYESIMRRAARDSLDMGDLAAKWATLCERAKTLFLTMHDRLDGVSTLRDKLSVAAEDANVKHKKCDSEDVNLRPVDAAVAELLQSDALTPPDKDSLSDEVVTWTIKRLRAEDRGKSVRTRCLKLCPMCKLACSHSDGVGHEGNHTCAHQPQGLCGSHDRVSLVLTPESCTVAARKNMSFYLDDDAESTPYREFTRRFPVWETPDQNSTVSQRVREYIFFHKQELLVQMYSRYKACTGSEMPPEYDHNPDDLRSQLKQILDTGHTH